MFWGGILEIPPCLKKGGNFFMSLPTTAATTLENLKSFLGINAQDTSKDSLYELLIESCTEAAERYIGRNIVARTITEEPHDKQGSKTKYLQVCQYPISSITSIVEDGQTIDTTILKLDKYNGIIKKPTNWKGAVLVTYIAGLAQDTASVPKNIQLAIWQWVKDILNLQENCNIKGETLGDYSVSYYEEHSIPSQVTMLLEGYRRIDL